MPNTTPSPKVPKCTNACHTHPAGGGALYGLGTIGALVYYLPGSSGVGDFLFRLGKALVWPALVVYHILTLWKL